MSDQATERVFQNGIFQQMLANAWSPGYEVSKAVKMGIIGKS